MAETKKPATTVDERVEVFIPRATGGDDPNLFVSVNDYQAILPRGKKSLVPKFIADEINRAMAAEAKFYDSCDSKEKASK